MKFDENDLLSATELNRNPSRYVALAMQGRRQIVLRDNVPVAALIGMDDLRRLDAATAHDESASCATSPTDGFTADRDTLSPAPSGYTALGADASSQAINVAVAANHLIVGATGSGRHTALSAAITGANPLRPTQFIVLTRHPSFTVQHAFTSPDTLSVISDCEDEGADDQRQLWAALDAEVDKRRELLTGAEVDTLAELRSAVDDPRLPDIVLVLDDVGTTLAHDRKRNLSRWARFGIFQWWSFQRFDVGRQLGVRQAEINFDTQIALRMASAAESRHLLGTADAGVHTPKSRPGDAYLKRTVVDAGPPTKFRFAAPQPDARTRIQRRLPTFLNHP